MCHVFKHFVPTKVVFGRKSLDKLPEELDFLHLKFERPAIICGTSQTTKGFAERIKNLLGRGEIFPRVKPDPTVESVKELLEEVKKFNPDLIIAVGGGSPLDSAKAVSACLKNPGNIEEFIGVPEVFKNPGVPLICIPTTAGSGSEVTPYAVLTDRKRLKKAPIVSHKIFPVLAILDPELTVSMSRVLTVNTGVDALTHAIEAYISKRRTPVSAMFSEKAVELIVRYLPRASGNPWDMEARENMLLASLFGGFAIADAGAGLVHTLAHILGVIAEVPHGLANGVFLVPVLRFYGLSIEMEIRTLGRISGLGESVKEFLENLEAFLEELGIPKNLKYLGVEPRDVPIFSKLAMEKRHLMGNLPKIPSEREIVKIVESIL